LLLRFSLVAASVLPVERDKTAAMMSGALEKTSSSRKKKNAQAPHQDPPIPQSAQTWERRVVAICRLFNRDDPSLPRQLFPS